MLGAVFAQDFMLRALVAGLLVGTLCAVLSAFIVFKRWAFIGQGIAHAAFGGVALGLLLGVNITWTALVFCVGTAYLIGFTSRRGKVSADSAIGIFLTASMALGVLFLGFRRHNVEVFSYLFGNILATEPQDLYATALVAALSLGFIGLFYKELWCYAFDEEMAGLSGLPVGLLHYGLLTIIALTTVVAIKAVGLILVSALLILPAAIAKQLTGRFPATIALAVLVAAAGVVLGLWTSYAVQGVRLASGATIVLALFLFFLVALALSPRPRLKAR